jgi:predicted nucleotidyltransferase
MGLLPKRETIQLEEVRRGIEIDLVTHDAFKFFSLLLKRNGYVLEQLYSPLIVRTSAEHEELKEIAKGCITCHHSHHYLGFSASQWDLFRKENPARVKPLLYVYRVLLTGIHLMRTGEIQANILTLNEEFNLSYVADLVDRKLRGPEQSVLGSVELSFFEGEYRRLTALLEASAVASDLPEAPVALKSLNDLLIRVRAR